MRSSVTYSANTAVNNLGNDFYNFCGGDKRGLYEKNRIYYCTVVAGLQHGNGWRCHLSNAHFFAHKKRKEHAQPDEYEHDGDGFT